MQKDIFNAQSSSPRACPICGSKNVKLCHQQKFSNDFAGSLLTGYDVVVCQVCGLGYADRIPSQELLDIYYASFSKYENADRAGHGSTFDTLRFQSIAEIILNTLSSKQDFIVDIGCATGELLGILKKNSCQNVFGLDPSPHCAVIAKKLYRVQVITGDIHKLHALGKQFQYVIMIGVMEHIRDLEATFKELREILMPGGKLMIEVPDVTMFAQYPDAPFQQFSTEHINFFSPRSLESLLEVNGFNQVYCDQFERRVNSGTTSPVVLGVYEFFGGNPLKFVRDYETLPAVERYIQKSKKTDIFISHVIENLVESQIPLIIWGVGTHTLRLLAESKLSEANISAFVDSNPKYWTLELKNIPILTPKDIIQRQETILISSMGFQDEIEQKIRGELAMKNPIIKLYEL